MWLRSSGLPYACPRMYALSRYHREPLDGDVDSELAWIFGTGTAIHSHWQEEYLPTLGDVFQGWWHRWGKVVQGEPLEGPLSHGWIPRPSGPCRYLELEFREPRLRLTGHCDGILCWPGEEPEVLELKTIGERGFAYVDGSVGHPPRAEHIMQVHAYMMFTGLSRSRIVYIRKGLDNKIRDCLSEHVIHRDDQIVAMIEDMIRQCVDAIDGPLDSLSPIEALLWVDQWQRLDECDTKRARRAINCTMRERCFAK